MAEFNPAATSSDYDSQVAFWNKVSAILEGEAAVKRAGQTYLPKFAKEKDAVYEYRLAASPFTNIYSDISKNLASKPFSKELVLAEGAPAAYVKLAENIDGQGNNLHVFASVSFKASLDKATDWIFVDYTKARPRPDGKALSRAEEAEQGLRPYWVHVPAERMLSVYSDFVGSSEVIHHVAMLETSKEVDPVSYTEVVRERVRILRRQKMVDDLGQTLSYGPATWALWEKSTSEGKTSWTLVGEGPITIGVIPVVPVILTKRAGGSWVAEPAIRDIADMQMTEYRQESNLEWVKIMTCFPMVCVSGMATVDAKGNDVEVTVGPNTTFLIPQNSAGTGPAGTVSVVEPSSQSIAENRTQLELTRKEMRDLGMQRMAEGAETVITAAGVAKKASSAAQAWAFRFKDAIEQAWKFTAMWLGDASVEPEIVIHTDFAVEIEQGNVLDSLLKAEGQGVFSAETVRAEFKRRNAVSNDVDEEEEQERLAKQQEGQQLQPEKMIDPVTGQPIVVTPEHGVPNAPPQMVN